MKEIFIGGIDKEENVVKIDFENKQDEANIIKKVINTIKHAIKNHTKNEVLDMKRNKKELEDVTEDAKEEDEMDESYEEDDKKKKKKEDESEDMKKEDIVNEQNFKYTKGEDSNYVDPKFTNEKSKGKKGNLTEKSIMEQQNKDMETPLDTMSQMKLKMDMLQEQLDILMKKDQQREDFEKYEQEKATKETIENIAKEYNLTGDYIAEKIDSYFKADSKLTPLKIANDFKEILQKSLWSALEESEDIVEDTEDMKKSRYYTPLE